MDILIHCVWHVKVHHKSDIDKVKSSAEYSSADHHFEVSIQKTLQTNFQSLLTNKITRCLRIQNVTNVTVLSSVRLFFPLEFFFFFN